MREAPSLLTAPSRSPCSSRLPSALPPRLTGPPGSRQLLRLRLPARGPAALANTTSVLPGDRSGAERTLQVPGLPVICSLRSCYRPNARVPQIQMLEPLSPSAPRHVRTPGQVCDPGGALTCGLRSQASSLPNSGKWALLCIGRERVVFVAAASRTRTRHPHARRPSTPHARRPSTLHAPGPGTRTHRAGLSPVAGLEISSWQTERTGSRPSTLPACPSPRPPSLAPARLRPRPLCPRVPCGSLAM